MTMPSPRELIANTHALSASIACFDLARLDEQVAALERVGITVSTWTSSITRSRSGSSSRHDHQPLAANHRTAMTYT